MSVYLVIHQSPHEETVERGRGGIEEGRED